MKQRFYLILRCGTYYLQDARTKKQRSLETKDRYTAMRLLEIKRQADTCGVATSFQLLLLLSHAADLSRAPKKVLGERGGMRRLNCNQCLSG